MSVQVRLNAISPYQGQQSSPAIRDIAVSGHTRHPLRPETHLQLRPVYAIVTVTDIHDVTGLIHTNQKIVSLSIMSTTVLDSASHMHAKFFGLRPEKAVEMDSNFNRGHRGGLDPNEVVADCQCHTGLVQSQFSLTWSSRIWDSRVSCYPAWPTTADSGEKCELGSL